MPARKILQIGEESLRMPCNPVDDIMNVEVQNAIRDLIDTHHESNQIGLAAPQIGIQLRLFLTELSTGPNRTLEQSDPMRIYINPVITSFSSEMVELFEGCLSVAGGNFCLPVFRPRQITIEAFNEKGNKFTLTTNGLLARCIQHEYDHLEGVLIIDKALNLKMAISSDQYRIISKSRPDYIEARNINVKDVIYY